MEVTLIALEQLQQDPLTLSFDVEKTVEVNGVYIDCINLLCFKLGVKHKDVVVVELSNRLGFMARAYVLPESKPLILEVDTAYAYVGIDHSPKSVTQSIAKEVEA